ncbi:sulfotransferase [Candidatus Omnitrophota bacterium]
MKLLFVSGPGRSGTTLLRDLLDGHPQISVWPNEWQYISLYTRYVNKDLSEKMSVSEILTCFQKDRSKFAPVLDGTVNDHRLSDRKGRFLELNPDFATRAWAEKDKRVDAKEFYYLVANSFKWLDSQEIFCNKCNDPENIIDYIAYFRKAKFIFIIRDPVESYISKLKHRAKGYPLGYSGFPHSIPLFSFLEIKDFFKMLHVVRSIPDIFKNILILKMEDMLDDRIGKLKEMTDFLKIDYTDSLNRLTFFGEPVPGYFVDHKEGADNILSKEATIDKEAALTINEKKWFSTYETLFSPYYPDIEEKIDKIKTVSLFARSYRYYKKYQKIKSISFLRAYLKLLKVMD